MRIIMSVLLVLLSFVPVQAGELTVSAAASLTDAFDDVKQAFEAANPGVTVVMNYASSGALYRQIEQGAPADVYASANPKWMNEAESKGFIVEETRKDFASNGLVLITPADNPAQVASVDDLTESRVTRIGIGTPETVPAGQYAKGSLESLNLFETLAEKYVFGENVRQILDYARRGEVDAAFVYNTDAVKGGEEVKIIVDMPLPKPITYPVAALRTAADPELAVKFLDFLTGPEGMALLEGRGFLKP